VSARRSEHRLDRGARYHRHSLRTGSSTDRLCASRCRLWHGKANLAIFTAPGGARSAHARSCLPANARAGRHGASATNGSGSARTAPGRGSRGDSGSAAPSADGRPFDPAGLGLSTLSGPVECTGTGNGRPSPPEEPAADAQNSAISLDPGPSFRSRPLPAAERVDASIPATDRGIPHTLGRRYEPTRRGCAEDGAALVRGLAPPPIAVGRVHGRQQRSSRQRRNDAPRFLLAARQRPGVWWPRTTKRRRQEGKLRDGA
jgi:hypothetical protein